MHPFEYRKASSIADAYEGWSAGSDARWLAGGMSLLPAMKLRLSAPDLLVDIAGLPELSGICVEGDSLRIGAATTHYNVLSSPEIAENLPVLARLARGIGDVQVRYRGTIGGSVANADPAADYPAAVLGLRATIITNRREIQADVFFTDLFQTALAPDELITAFRFPLPIAATYLKFANLASRFAIVGLFMARFDNEVRVAVTGAGNSVFRLPAFEAALSCAMDPAALEGIRVPPDDLASDIHATSEYRAHLIKTLARRAAQEIRSEHGG